MTNATASSSRVPLPRSGHKSSTQAPASPKEGTAAFYKRLMEQATAAEEEEERRLREEARKLAEEQAKARRVAEAKKKKEEEAKKKRDEEKRKKEAKGKSAEAGTSAGKPSSKHKRKAEPVAPSGSYAMCDGCKAHGEECVKQR